MTDITFSTTETGDLNARYTNGYGANLHGYIWLGTDAATVGVTGISSKSLPYGREAAATLAINNAAYRAKIVETAKAELTRQFLATNPAREG